MALRLQVKKASISPIPLSLIAVIISLIFLLALYYMISGGLGALASLVMDFHNCITNPLSCIAQVIT